MPELEALLDVTSIVLLGRAYDARAFRPASAFQYGLLTVEDAAKADLRLIAGDVTHYVVPDWLRVLIDRERAEFACLRASEEPRFRDFVVGMLREAKQSTTSAIGINRETHYKMPSREALDAVGHRLAPKDQWNPLMQNPGLLSLSMRGTIPGLGAEYVNTKIEPSATFHAQFGLYVNCNFHFKLTEDADSARVAALVESNWRACLDSATAQAKRLAGVA